MHEGTLLMVALCFALLCALAPQRAAADDGAFAIWREALWPDARAAGVTRPTFDKAFAGVEPDLSLPDLVLPGRTNEVRGQAEFTRPPRDYLDRAYLAKLAVEGRALMRKYADTLQRIETEIGVEPQVVLAIWGRETAFGNYRLPHYAIKALATEAYLGRRKEMFRNELVLALKMLEDKVATIDQLRSSWAGALGLPQFMPSEFYQWAYDIDHDGRKDIWSPPDALASAANQLKGKGWTTGLPWGWEVRVPATADCALEGPHQARAIADWAGMGFKPANGSAFEPRFATAQAYLMMPAGAHGPAFLVTGNFTTLRAYNTSDLYALFVGSLADRITGGGDFVTPWSDVGQIANRDIEEIQRRLDAAGYPMAKLDGKIGSMTRATIGAYQKRKNIAVDCWPSAAVLATLKGSR